MYQYATLGAQSLTHYGTNLQTVRGAKKKTEGRYRGAIDSELTIIARLIVLVIDRIEMNSDLKVLQVH